MEREEEVEEVYFVCPFCAKREYLPDVYEVPLRYKGGVRILTYSRCKDCIREQESAL